MNVKHIQRLVQWDKDLRRDLKAEAILCLSSVTFDIEITSRAVLNGQGSTYQVSMSEMCLGGSTFKAMNRPENNRETVQKGQKCMQQLLHAWGGQHFPQSKLMGKVLSGKIQSGPAPDFLSSFIEDGWTSCGGQHVMWPTSLVSESCSWLLVCWSCTEPRHV